jgi:putative ABC transport system substrate-binding protein
MVPNAVHIALLINAANTPANTETTTQNLQEASRRLGLQIHVISASRSDEIDSAFATLARERLDALFVAADAFLLARRVQLATLAARDRIPAIYPGRQMVEAGGLMSYGSDLVNVFYQVGVYCGKVLNGANPADLPVAQTTRLVFAINMKAARLLGIAVPRVRWRSPTR